MFKLLKIKNVQRHQNQKNFEWQNSVAKRSAAHATFLTQIDETPMAVG